jgi:hypothetical protein
MMAAKTPSVSAVGNSNSNSNSNNNSNNQSSSSSSSIRKEQIKRRPRGGRLLLYFVILFAICWLQIAANVFAYFSSHYEQQQQQDQTQPSAVVARFSSYYSSDGNSGKANLLRGSNNNTTDGNIEQQQQQQQPPSTSLEVQLSQLQTRLRLLQQQQHQQEEFNYDINTNSTATATKVVFIPFTIRDAQRTVPTQIPHGFHIFDFIDLYASDADGEQNQTQTEITDTLTNITTTITTKSKLYHNGKPVIVVPGVVREEEECRGYTKKCYRTKMLRVIKYLQSLQHQNTNTNNYEYYYFYMEADNDLCVPLDEIKQIALEYRRYFINTGEGISGASGWIMSQQFLNDFYSYWYNIFNNNNNNNTLSLPLLIDEQKLEPNTVASIILKQKQNWSVTRRYLTSHSILVGNTNDADSISNLYEHEEEEGNVTNATYSSNNNSSKVAIVVSIATAPGNNNTAAADVAADEQHPDYPMALLEKLTSKKLLTASLLDSKKSLSWVMEPARYLPRCLEPHRGIWPEKKNETDNNHDNKNNNNNNNNNVAIDMYHWDFFDYDLCPESDIFPCKEGQLGMK